MKTVHLFSLPYLDIFLQFNFEDNTDFSVKENLFVFVSNIFYSKIKPGRFVQGMADMEQDFLSGRKRMKRI